MTMPPEFKFSVAASYPDPMRRQIREGLDILETGTLNKRMEFNNNQICRLVAVDSHVNSDADLEKQLRERQWLNSTLNNFIYVMRNVSQLSPSVTDKENVILSEINDDDEKSLTLHCRLSKRKRGDMETSTPVNVRRERAVVMEEDDSPIGGLAIDTGNHTNGDSMNGTNEGLKTGISDEASNMLLTPPRVETSSQSNLRLALGARDLSDAALNTGLRRASSLPNLRNEIEENALFSNFPSRVVYDLNGARSRSLEDMMNNLSPWQNSDCTEHEDEQRPSPVRPEQSSNVAQNLRQEVLIIGSAASPTTLLMKATPHGPTPKRQLFISPESDFPRSRKVSIHEDGSPELRGKDITIPFPRRKLLIKRKVDGGSASSTNSGGRVVDDLTKTQIVDDLTKAPMREDVHLNLQAAIYFRWG